MPKSPLYLYFALTLFVALFGTALLPSLKLLAFAPFLVVVFFRLSFPGSLWVSFLCGLLIDLVSFYPRFGITSLNYALVTCFLYPQKRHFFEDKDLSLPIFTILVSFLSTLLQILLIGILDKNVPFTPRSILSDFFVMPLLDGLYAYIWILCPLKLYEHVHKMGWRNVIKKQVPETED